MSIFTVGIVMFGVVYAATNAVWPSFYGETFSARVRLSGMAIGTQIGFGISGFLPTIAAAVGGSGKGAWFGVAPFTAGRCAVKRHRRRDRTGDLPGTDPPTGRQDQKSHRRAGAGKPVDAAVTG